MKTSNKQTWLLGVMALFAVTCADAYPGENIALDPITGNYIITYWDDSTEDYQGNPTQPEFVQTTFVPATKIDPTIKSRFRMRGDNVNYNYSLSNGKTARQAIVSIYLEHVGRVAHEQDVLVNTATDSELESAIFANMSSLDSPEEWHGNIIRVVSRIVWSTDNRDNDGVRAGRSLSGFGLYSPVLPGISEASLKGEGGIFGYGGAGPDLDSDIAKQIQALRDNDFILRNVAAPTVVVPTPFDAALLMDRIRAEMLSWTGKQFLDTTFANQLDRYLSSATEAYRHNQPKAAKEHIEAVRKMLEREHKLLDHDDEDGEDSVEHKAATRNTIDRLAARVLDFDLKYVLKRTEQEDKENDGKKSKDKESRKER